MKKYLHNLLTKVKKSHKLYVSNMGGGLNCLFGLI